MSLVDNEVERDGLLEEISEKLVVTIELESELLEETVRAGVFRWVISLKRDFCSSSLARVVPIGFDIDNLHLNPLFATILTNLLFL